MFEWNPREDLLLLLGDFNIHVGISDMYRASGLWSSVFGYFGIEHCNQAGEDLLNFCDLNQLSKMNTWFQKQSDYFGTWTHPVTWYCSLIDFVIMRSPQRQYYLDVQVARGLVRVKLRFDLCCSRHRTAKRPPPVAVWKFADAALREDFAKKVSEELENIDCSDASSAVSVWDQLRSCLVSSAIEVVGSGGRQQLDWFLENKQVLSPFWLLKKHAWDQVLSVGSPYTHRRFRQCQPSRHNTRRYSPPHLSSSSPCSRGLMAQQNANSISSLDNSTIKW